MKLLAIDTSGPVCGVAVLADGAIVYEASAVNRMTHSVNLLPMIDAAMQSAGLTIAALDRLAVVTGPGSFTGVRIGVSTLKGLAHGAAGDRENGIPCGGVDALEAMALGAGEFRGIICPIQDARAGQVYGAAFAPGEMRPLRLMADEPLKLEEYVEKSLTLGERFLFVGDGMPVHRAKLEGSWATRLCLRSLSWRICGLLLWRTWPRWKRKPRITAPSCPCTCVRPMLR